MMRAQPVHWVDGVLRRGEGVNGACGVGATAVTIVALLGRAAPYPIADREHLLLEVRPLGRTHWKRCAL